MKDLRITKIETGDDPTHETYTRRASVWFDTGGRIRFVETADGRILEQTFLADDPHSVWDDVVITEEGRDDYDFDAVFVTSLEVLFEYLRRGEYAGDWALEQIAGERGASPTNVEYEH